MSTGTEKFMAIGKVCPSKDKHKVRLFMGSVNRFEKDSPSIAAASNPRDILGTQNQVYWR
jgi:hypothetical protein